MLDKISSSHPFPVSKQQQETVPKNENLMVAKEQSEKIVKNKEDLEKIVKSMNEFMIPSHTSLKFELHEKLDTYYVQIIDDSTKEVVNEIPSKKMLDMYAAMKEFLGLMVDKKI